MKLLGGEWSKADLFAAIAAAIAAIAAIAACLAIPGIPKLFHWDDVPQTATEPTKPYAGLVMSESRNPVPDALVIASQDEAVGQTIRADDNGQFQMRIHAPTKSLRLTVSAAGFETAKVQASLDRTGPEEIKLHAVTTPPPPEARRNPHPADGAQKPNVTPAPIPEAKPTVPASPSQQPPSNNGIINNAPNFGTQNVNPLRPPPSAGFYIVPLQAPVSAPPGATDNQINSGVSLRIFVDRAFDEPSFDVACSTPCRIGSPMLIRRENRTEYSTNAIHIAEHKVTSDLTRHRISFQERLNTGTYIGLDVTFDSPDGAGKVLSVHTTPISE